MDNENKTLLRLLKDARSEISQCFSQYIGRIDGYEDTNSKDDTLAAATVTPSSMLDGLKDIAAAIEGKALSQAASFQLQDIANSVDRALEKWISGLTNNSVE